METDHVATLVTCTPKQIVGTGAARVGAMPAIDSMWRDIGASVRTMASTDRTLHLLSVPGHHLRMERSEDQR